MPKKKDYWYRKFVEEKFRSMDRLERTRGKALSLQAKEYKRRLNDLNGEASRLRNIQSTYVPREVFENSLKSVSDKTEASTKILSDKLQDMFAWQSKLQGKIAVTVIVGGVVWGVIVSLMFFILNRYFK